MSSPLIWFGTKAKLLKQALTFPDSTTNTATIQTPSSVTSYTWTLPSAQGSAATYLGNDGSGNLSWTSPASTIPVTSKTTTYSATTADGLILCSGSAFTVTLPAASNTGAVLRIQKTDSSLSNIITISRAGSDTIEGDTTTTLNTQYEEVTLVADGTSTWYILDRNIDQTWQTYSLSITGSVSNPTKGTVAIDQALWRRIGDSIEIIYTFKQTSAGSAGSGNYLFSIPSGMTMDTSKITVGNGDGSVVGPGYFSNASDARNAASWNILVFAFDSSHIGLALPANNTNQFTNIQSGDGDLSNTNLYYFFRATLPISGWKGK